MTSSTKFLFAMGGEVFVRSAERFVQRVEKERGRYVRGDGPVFALYETVKAIEDVAIAGGRLHV
ncbi:hypothetical protein [Micromonospora fulviviridis]|uniref:hypothetical protein n=1 Tax=Micromonospora fulviviridis TaxID=47860 RepID=UPI0037950A8E